MRTAISKIGNSKGIVLSNKILSELQLTEGSEVEIVVVDGAIKIMPINGRVVNAELSSWDLQYQAALKAGQKQEKNVFDGGLAH